MSLEEFFTNSHSPYIVYFIDSTARAILNTILGFQKGRLEKLQKREVRIISNSKTNCHTDSLFNEFYLLRVNYIFEINVLTLL